MRHYKLPFSINLERKYNDINISDFPTDWEESTKTKQNRTIEMENDLHIEIGKFTSFNISIDEMVDLGMRYALGKQEFRKIAAQLIEQKNEE